MNTFSANERLAPEPSLPATLSSLYGRQALGPRFMGLPYATAMDRSMYSLYGSLVGMSGVGLSSLALQGLSPISHGALSPTSLPSPLPLLTSSPGQTSISGPASSAGAMYHNALYSQRYHPYMPLAMSPALKRPASGSSPLSLP